MSNSMPKVQTLFLKQFTAFEEAHFEFCPGINVLIGANGTGKSHVMKIIYTLLKATERAHTDEFEFIQVLPKAIQARLYTTFQTYFNLVRQGGKKAFVHLDYGNTYLEFGIEFEPDDVMSGGFCEFSAEHKPENIPSPAIYLPAQEFLSINEGFISAYEKRELPYDDTYYDLSLALNALPLRKKKLVNVQDVITFLRKAIAGEQAKEREVVTQDNGRFTFSLPEGKLDVHLVAEGYRKIATLYYLLRNGSLTKDSILFWDEPEANLNPKLIVEIAKVLRMLASLGMQIFVATHDYLLSHELSLLAEYPSDKSVDIKFFALHKPDRKGGVLVESGQTLAELEHNPILEEFAAHYDREVNLFHSPEVVGS